MSNQLFLLIILQLPGLLLALSVHEMAHGYAAYRKGDFTAKLMGRVTLNPARHIDPMGTVLVPIMLAISGLPVFGWAKPVPVTISNFKNPRKDNAIVSLAGPASNFILAIALALVLKILFWVAGPVVIRNSAILAPLAQIIYFGIKISVILGVFNLLPVHPLDGSHMMEGVLPKEQAKIYSRHDRYGPFILLILIFTGILWKIIGPIYELIFDSLMKIIGL